MSFVFTYLPEKLYNEVHYTNMESRSTVTYKLNSKENKGKHITFSLVDYGSHIEKDLILDYYHKVRFAYENSCFVSLDQ